MHLDAMFSIAKDITDADQLHKMMLLIFKNHGGLCESYQRNYGKQLQPYEIMGYAWEALPIAIVEWDSKLGKASTIWGKIIRRITTAQRENNMYRGGVKVGLKVAGRYTGVGYEDGVVGAVDYEYRLTREDEDGTILFGDGTDCRSRISVEE